MGRDLQVFQKKLLIFFIYSWNIFSQNTELSAILDYLVYACYVTSLGAQIFSLIFTVSFKQNLSTV